MAWTPWVFWKTDQENYYDVYLMLILQIKEHCVYITVLLQGGCVHSKVYITKITKLIS